MVIDDTAQLDPATHPDRTVAAPLPPVFVDASGRRQRRVRRAGRLLAVPAAGYLVLLASNLLGGPAVHAPFLPQPPAQSADTPSGAAPGEPSQAAEPDPAASPAATRRAAAPTTHRATDAPPTGPGAAESTTAPGTGTPTSAAPPTPGHGKPSSPNSHKPTKSP
ncbi:hypothetical protein GCM10010441_72940 [Kitasatospora paracochleata]|uniref:Uncharacterized protein n=1 Tax=Kitasatospora paracochleata TaxID=58354 RepID=A0ABT1J6W0_9ACTN|nr:hypothetical protein [Kitasatospora paracochleata]MCP2312781.1 hypothetical protein [Kitasatospora paracochleata]